MRYLLDTNILIDISKGAADKLLILEKLGEDQMTTSVICLGEFLEGLDANGVNKLERMINGLTTLEIGQKEIYIFAEIRKQLRPKGILIDNMDILIAATAIANDLILITDNLKHFSRVKGLKIYG